VIDLISSDLDPYDRYRNRCKIFLIKKILVAAVLPLKMINTNVVSVNSVGSN